MADEVIIEEVETHEPFAYRAFALARGALAATAAVTFAVLQVFRGRKRAQD